MARSKISQAQAVWYKRRAEAAEEILANQRNRWRQDFRPGWVNIDSIALPDVSFAKLVTARLLGHALIAVPSSDGNNRIHFYAEPLATERSRG